MQTQGDSAPHRYRFVTRLRSGAAGENRTAMHTHVGRETPANYINPHDWREKKLSKNTLYIRIRLSFLLS